jgi:hypothetical protein
VYGHIRGPKKPLGLPACDRHRPGLSLKNFIKKVIVSKEKVLIKKIH